MPPAPSSVMTSYGPTRVPELNAIRWRLVTRDRLLSADYMSSPRCSRSLRRHRALELGEPVQDDHDLRGWHLNVGIRDRLQHYERTISRDVVLRPDHVW